VHRWVACIVVGASFGALFGGVLRSLVGLWLENDTYSHGFLVPLVTAYLLWERRRRFAALPVEPALASGSLLLAAGLASFVAGQVGGIVTLSYLSPLVTLFGVVLVLLGRRITREARFPLLFLLFMIPVWDVFTERLHAPFQLLSARLGGNLAALAGVPVRIEGVYLVLPSVTLEVARACSGVNYVVAILALALPQAYLSLRSVPLRFGVAAFAVWIALLTNGLRVGVISALTHMNGWSAAQIHGPSHVFQALSVAVVGIAVVCGTIALLAAWSPRAPQSNQGDDRECAHGLRAWRVRAGLLAAVCLALLSTALLEAAPTSRPVELDGALSRLPIRLGRWTAERDVVGPLAFAPQSDNSLSRWFTNPEGRRIVLHVAYFQTQTQGHEAVNEQTLQLERSGSVVAIGGADPRRRANEVLLAGRQPRVVLHWYQINGRSTANGLLGKTWTILDSLVRQRSNGALVVVEAPVVGEDAPGATAAARELAELAAPEIDAILPR
jgi:EpsI family protein